MQELLATARNVACLSTEDGKLTPMVEVICVTSEPEFSVDAGGELIRTRIPRTIRFHATPEALRLTAKAFQGYADDAEKVVAEHEEGEPEKPVEKAGE